MGYRLNLNPDISLQEATKILRDRLFGALAEGGDPNTLANIAANDFALLEVDTFLELVQRVRENTHPDARFYIGRAFRQNSSLQRWARQEFRKILSRVGISDISRITSEMIADMPLDKVFQLIRFDAFTDTVNFFDENSSDFISALKAGILRNKAVKEWYEAELPAMTAHAINISKDKTWSGHAERFRHLRAAWARVNPDFLALYDLIVYAMETVYQEVGQKQAGKMHAARFKSAVFGRDETTYPLLHVFKEHASMPAYKKRISAALEGMFPAMRDFLTVTNAQIQLGRTLADIDPEYAHKPTGTVPGKTNLEFAKAVCSILTGHISMPETFFPFSKKMYVMTYDDVIKARNIITHEGLHHVAGCTRVAITPQVAEAYKKDINNFLRSHSPEERVRMLSERRLRYFAEKKYGGMHENEQLVWEEIVAQITADLLNGKTKSNVIQLYPNLFKVTEQICRDLNAQYRAFPDATVFPWGPTIEKAFAPKMV